MKFRFERKMENKLGVDIEDKLTSMEIPCQICGTFGHITGNCATGFKIIKIRSESYMQTVELYTSLDKWQKGELMTYNRFEGLFKLYKNFPIGKHEFKFHINKNTWAVSDYFPKCPTKDKIINNYMVVKPFKSKEYVLLKLLNENNQDSVEVKIMLTDISLKYMLKQLKKPKNPDIKIEVFGSWNDWSSGDLMKMHNCTDNACFYWYVKKQLLVRYYEYKFVVDGEWVLDIYRNSTANEDFSNHTLDLPRLLYLKVIEEKKIQLSTSSCFKTYLLKSDTLEFFSLYGHSMDAIGPKIYIYGGFCRNSFINSILEVNPDNFEVDVIEMDDKNSPSKISFHRTVKYGEKIIIYGGQNENKISNKYHTYNTITRNWTSNPLKNSIPERELFSIVHRNGTFKLYIFGGYYCSADLEVEYNLNDLYVLHLDTLSFEKVEALNSPKARCHHTANIIGSFMYIFGGCEIDYLTKRGFNDIYKIDVDNEDDITWTYIKPDCACPAPRYGHIALNIGKYILVNGGRNSIDDIDIYYWDLWVFDTLKNIWTEVEIGGDKLKLARAFHSGCLWEKNIFIFGGKFSKRNSQYRLVKKHNVGQNCLRV